MIMLRQRRTACAGILLLFFLFSCGSGQTPLAPEPEDQGEQEEQGEITPPTPPADRAASPEGLVMAGYQGWFNTPGDGQGLKWKHYELHGVFAPGQCSIDLWPEVSEYKKTYETEFKYSDGSTARVFSSHDASTTDLHFKWMRDYGLDGVFVQRFVTNLKSKSGRRENATEILLNCVAAAGRYDRILCVMYDLTGMASGDSQYVKEDWAQLAGTEKLPESKQYLHYQGKPLVAVYGIGFKDREYSLDECAGLIAWLKEQGCAVMIGVPNKWRTLSGSATDDPKLLEVVKGADIVHPWFVGSYNASNFNIFQSIIKEDMTWCRQYGKLYIPTVFPGFSWHNLKGGEAPLNHIPRLKGDFFWNQIYYDIYAGAKSLYIAMFDEIDEGTAIFKCANQVPVGASPFVSYEGVPADRYLFLAGQAARTLRGEIKLSKTKPEQE